ncbi:MAG: ankyrin repeat domain-containing protein [Fretibacterium sp.]|nr:ankyrin repeat domain-containing protein [Fretibacterium sp.]
MKMRLVAMLALPLAWWCAAALALPAWGVDDAAGFLEICRSGREQQIIDALDAGADANAKDNEGVTALMYAIAGNPNPSIVPLLLDAGADARAVDANGRTALMVAARANRNPGVVAVLLSTGTDVNAKDKSGWTALMMAGAFNKNADIIAILVDAGAIVNARTSHGQTALMFSAGLNNNPAVIAALLDAGADVNVRDEGGRMAVGYARDNGNISSFEYALRRRRNEEDAPEVIQAAERGEAGAQYQLGLMYSHGEGVAGDQWEAIEWFRRAAAQGHEPAQAELAKRGIYD